MSEFALNGKQVLRSEWKSSICWPILIVMAFLSYILNQKPMALFLSINHTKVLLMNALPMESRKSYNMFVLIFLDVDLSDVGEKQPYDYKFVKWMITSKVRCLSHTLVLKMLFCCKEEQYNCTYEIMQ